MPKRFAKYVNIYTIANAFFAFIIVRGIYISFFMNSVNRSLWLDEGFLAESFSTRSLAHIFLDGQFANLQSAPLLWLYFEKILTILFGNTEYVLRIGSIIGFTGSIAVLIFILAYFYKSKLPLAAAALFANLPFILQYSNVFKPYIFDGFVSLLILAVYGLWIKQKLNTRWLALIWAVLLWVSQTGCFIVAGCLLCEFVFSLAHKDRQELRRVFLLGVVIAVSFVVYYFAWGARMTSISNMQSCWANKFFPLFPSSTNELRRGVSLIGEIFRQFDKASLFITACTGASIAYAVWKKDKLLIGAFLSIGVALFASFLKMYPIQDRLWCFSYPVFIVLSFATLDGIVNRKQVLHGIFALFLIIIVIAQNGYKHYSVSSNVYWIWQELNMELDYLAKHMEPSDQIYVFDASRPTFQYKNGYGNKSFGGGSNNVILETNIQKVVNHKKIWIVSSTADNREWIGPLINAMQEKGYLELVTFPHETPLWWYCQSLDDAKIHFTMTAENIKDDGEYKEATIKIQNDGEAYLNNQFDDIFLINQPNGRIYKINGLIAPKQSKSITVRYRADEKPVFQLRSQHGKIAKDDTITLNEVSSSGRVEQ